MGLVDEGGRFHTARTAKEYGRLVEEDMNSLSDAEMEVLVQMINELGSYGKSPIMELAAGDLYRVPPVEMVRFLDDPYFCGNLTKKLFPAIREDLIEIFNGRYTEALIGGSLGAGKSTFARFALLRMLYEASCLLDPCAAYGVSAGDKIAFPCISVTEEKAHELVFDKIKTAIDQIPFFKNECPPQKITDEGGIVFQNGLWIPPGLSTERHVIGMNSFAAVMEEVNFFKNVRNTNPNRGNYSDVAEVIYKSIKRRMETRFLQKGKLPGMIIMISSKTSVNAFTERRIKEAADNPEIFVRESAVYEVVPQSRYCGKKFRVAIGNETQNSRILGDEDPDPEGMKVIEVPVEFKPSFEQDLEASIREIAGFSTVSITPFISRRDKIVEAIDSQRQHPFSEYIWKHDVPGRFLWSKLCKQTKDGAWEPLFFPQAPRFAAVDLSKTQDATGVAVGCMGPYVSVRRIGHDIEMVPSFHLDFVLRIEAATHGEVVQSEIRNLFYELSAHGFFIKSISADTFQSVSLLQTMRQQGYHTDIVSVDTKTGPYDLFKLALYEGRVSYYRYDPLLRELRELQKNWKTGKIDHPDQSDNPLASKDVSDAAAQVIFQVNRSASSTFVDAPLVPETLNKAKDDEYWVLENTMQVTNNPDDPTSHEGDVPQESWRIAAEQRLKEAQPTAPDWKKNFTMPFEMG